MVNSIAMFDAARDTVNAEATDLMSIYTLANSLPEARRTRIQALCKEYVKEVIDKGEGGGAIILAARELREPGGALVATVETSTFARHVLGLMNGTKKCWPCQNARMIGV